jgi:hypothetical protein
VLSGSVADTSRALERFKALPRLVAADGELEPPGPTVGNKPEGSPFGGVSSPSGTGGSPAGGIVSAGTVGVGVADGDGVLAAMTLIVAAEWKEPALVPRAVAVSVIRSPAEAARRTNAPATSSSLCPVGKVPTVQTARLGAGHTVKRGASMCAAFPRVAVTVTPRASATVLQTKI